MAMSVSAWVLALMLSDTTHSLSTGLLGARLAFISVTLFIYWQLILVLSLTNSKNLLKKALVLLLPGVLLLAFVPTQYVIQAVSIQSYGLGVQGGVVYTLFSAYSVIYLVSSLVILLRYMRTSTLRERVQLQYFLFGLAISATLVFITNLVLVRYAAFGPPSLLVFVGLTGYAMVRHRLFDIRLVVARTLAYVLLLTTLAILYGLGLFATTSLFFAHTQVGISEQATYLILALVLAFTFQPLRRFFEHITDQIFFRNRYDSQTVLAEFSNVLVRDIELNDLLKHSLTEISRSLSIGYTQFIIFNEGKVYRVAQQGLIPKRMIVAPQLKAITKPLVVADELGDGHVKELMDDHGLRVSAILKTHSEVIGYLLLGDKLSGDVYSKQDIDVIGIMAKELAVAISNAKAYAEIQAFAATLQERVNHATGRLRVANRHLKELDQAKDEFLSLASHQLRTPLTTIKGYLSMILEGDAGKLNKLQREFTTNAFDSSERMVRLITDLLDVSRMSAGRFVIQPKATDMNEVMRSEVQQLQSHAETKSLKLTLEEPSTPLPPVMLDENKTRQVIMNFVDNAIYYTEKGSVTASLSESKGKLRVEVRDTGMGVPEDAQKHLFSKFFRAANAQKSRPDGTGLGLFLAKRVIEDQGGEIIFHSEVGKGSTFGFELPMVKPKGGESGLAKPIVSETEPKGAVKV